jgi:hypothetical protein
VDLGHAKALKNLLRILILFRSDQKVIQVSDSIQVLSTKSSGF